MKIIKEKIIISILIPLVVGVVSALLTRNAMMTFQMVNKPPLSPPGWLFPVVWVILYVLMGIASYIVCQQGKEKPEVIRALETYGVQLVFNFFWSIFFFRLKWYGFSFVWLVVLWILILSMVNQFRKINVFAAVLIIPYLIWVSFAGYLNLGIALLN